MYVSELHAPLLWVQLQPDLRLTATGSLPSARRVGSVSWPWRRRRVNAASKHRGRGTLASASISPSQSKQRRPHSNKPPLREPRPRAFSAASGPSARTETWAIGPHLLADRILCPTNIALDRGMWTVAGARALIIRGTNSQA